MTPRLVILSAGAISSAVILLRSPSPKGKGLANSSDQVGRNFMNHNSAAMLAIDPRRRNDSVYQKTLMLNDYYLSDGKGGKPLGNVQLLGKIDGNMLAANVKFAPRLALDFMARHAVDWYLMCEDLPDPESRVMVDGDEIVLQWRRTNMQSLEGLTKVMRGHFRAAGYPIVLSRPFDKRTPSHQCGTVKMGNDPATARRSTFFAAPTTTRISSWSTAASCRPPRRSTRRSASRRRRCASPTTSARRSWRDAEGSSRGAAPPLTCLPASSPRKDGERKAGRNAGDSLSPSLRGEGKGEGQRGAG